MIYALCTIIFRFIVQNYKSVIYMLIIVDYLKKR